MKYILYPIYTLCVLLFTLYEILAIRFILLVELIWHFKKPIEGFADEWIEWHLELDGYDPGNSGHCKCDLTIKDTLNRRLSYSGTYKHTTHVY